MAKNIKDLILNSGLKLAALADILECSNQNVQRAVASGPLSESFRTRLHKALLLLRGRIDRVLAELGK